MYLGTARVMFSFTISIHEIYVSNYVLKLLNVLIPMIPGPKGIAYDSM